MSLDSVELRTEYLRANIKRGFVVHMDPDWLLLTYGDSVVLGFKPHRPIGARYAVCTDVIDGIYFWSLLTTSTARCEQNILVPDAARTGGWADNGKTNYIVTDSTWVTTLDMIVEAHLIQDRNKTLKGTFKYSFLKPHMVDQWPVTPVVYPKTFTPLPAPTPTEKAKPAEFSKLRVTGPLTDLPPTPMETPVSTPDEGFSETLPAAPTMDELPWNDWMASVRAKAGLSQSAVASRMSVPAFFDTTLSLIERGQRRISTHELATWAKAVGVVAHPKLKTIPLLTDAEEQRRQIFRSNRKLRGNTEPKAPVTPLAAVPAAPLEGLDRKALAARVERILANSRLRDDEVLEIATYVENRAMNLLMEGVS